MKWEEVADIVGELSCLKFFPADSAGRIAIMKLVGQIAENIDQVRWLVDRVLLLFDEWPGPRTLRLVFCTKYPPQDGIGVCGGCDQYPEGIPCETALLPVPSEPKRLQSGNVLSADILIDSETRYVARTLSMDAIPELSPEDQQRANDFAKLLGDIETGPPDRQPEQFLVKTRVRQSAILRLYPPLAEVKPVPFVPFTKEQVDELYRKHKEETREKQGKCEVPSHE